MINGHNETQRRLEKQYKTCPRNNVYYNGEKGYYVEEKWKPKAAIKFKKKENNRRLRRYKGELSNGNYYRKVSEMWWDIY